MNTKEELIAKYGINEYTAQSMLESYGKHIGEINGVIRIDDVTYMGDGARGLIMHCTLCGAEYRYVMRSGKFKWHEVRRTCPCEKERQREAAIREKALREQEKRREILNYIGSTYDDYTIKGIESKDYICSCSTCGKERRIAIGTVLNGVRKAKCTDCQNKRNAKYDESYIGRKNNMLKVIGIVPHGKSHRYFLCRCDCGNETVLNPVFWRNGTVKSCGCYQTYRSVDADETKRISSIYYGMKQRCLNSNNKEYHNYGGRGIKICDEWLESIDNFIKWSFENGYDNTKTIDRIDFNGNYEPSNCRWTTWEVQNTNRRPRKKASEYEKAV